MGMHSQQPVVAGAVVVSVALTRVEGEART
jgi:hypothetical protein